MQPLPSQPWISPWSSSAPPRTTVSCLHLGSWHKGKRKVSSPLPKGPLERGKSIMQLCSQPQRGNAFPDSGAFPNSATRTLPVIPALQSSSDPGGLIPELYRLCPQVSARQHSHSCAQRGAVLDALAHFSRFKALTCR